MAELTVLTERPRPMMQMCGGSLPCRAGAMRLLSLPGLTGRDKRHGRCSRGTSFPHVLRRSSAPSFYGPSTTPVLCFYSLLLTCARTAVSAVDQGSYCGRYLSSVGRGLPRA